MSQICRVWIGWEWVAVGGWCVTKHKKWILYATIHLTRKKFVFPGRYLKADHFGKKWT